MKLPEITKEILDKFGILHTQLIEWRGPSFNVDPYWTQTAVDFARLVAQGEKPKFLEVNGEQRRVVDVDVMVDIGHMQERIAELEAAGRALLEWDSRSWTGTSYGFNERMKGRDELKEIIRRFRAMLEPTEPDEERIKHPPCMECGAMTAKEAETKCRCGGDKDNCHGCELWPEG